MSRAQASLPSGYLSLRNAGNYLLFISKMFFLQFFNFDFFKSLGHGAQNGIFARKTIPKACRFGPAEGLEQRLNSIEDIIDDDDLSLVVINEDGSIVKLGTDISKKYKMIQYLVN